MHPELQGMAALLTGALPFFLDFIFWGRGWIGTGARTKRPWRSLRAMCGERMILRELQEERNLKKVCVGGMEGVSSQR